MGSTTDTRTTAGQRRHLVSRHISETRAIGRQLGQVARAGDVILLQGSLGVGKTALTQGIALGLGIMGPVTSPSFTLLKEYQGRLPLAHFDFYRVDPRRPVDLEFADYVGNRGVCVIEWAVRVPHIIPACALTIEITRVQPSDEGSALGPDIDEMADEAEGKGRRLFVATAIGSGVGHLFDALSVLADAEPVA